VIRVFDRPHREARALLGKGAPVYLFVNPVEYHGPHLSLHNDRLVSLGFARDVHARLQTPLGDHPLLLADDLEVGVEPCPGPGSRFSSYATVRDAVVDACMRLADLGAERVVLLTFHGSPLHSLAIQRGVEALRRRGLTALAPLNLALEDLLEEDTGSVAEAFDAIRDPDLRETVRAGLTRDFHAGFLETSLALHYAPDTVSPSHRDLPACPKWVPDRSFTALAAVARRMGRERFAAELEWVADGLGWQALRPFPGYTGRPDLADVDAGAVFARAFADRYAAHALAVFDGAAPAPPVLPWLLPLTLGGRMGGSHVELSDMLQIR